MTTEKITIRFPLEDINYIDKVQKQENLKNRSDALRFIVEQYKLENTEPDTGRVLVRMALDQANNVSTYTRNRQVSVAATVAEALNYFFAPENMGGQYLQQIKANDERPNSE